VPKIGEDLSLVEGDAGSGKDAGDFGLGDKGYSHRDAGGVCGDGVVDGGLEVDGEKIRRAPHVVDGAGACGTCAGTGKVGGIRIHIPRSYRKPDGSCGHWDGRRRSREDDRGET
jgi:hypothetical protein